MTRQSKQYGVLGLIILAMILEAGAIVAQNVRVTAAPGRDISRSQKYAWRENHIVAKQTPEGTAAMEAALKKAIDNELARKGYAPDPQSPEFFIHFEGGADFTSDASAFADPRLPTGTEVYKTQNPIGPGVNILPITTMRLSVIITDPSSDTPAWQADTTKKYKNPEKALKNLDNEITQTVKSALKTLPQRKKGK